MQNRVQNNRCPPAYDHSNLETLLKQSRVVHCDELTEEEEGVAKFLNKLYPRIMIKFIVTKFGRHRLTHKRTERKKDK